MGLSFARIKQWLGYENITNTDLNAEFNNILNKAGADTLSGANSTSGSTPTVVSMQATESPGNVGTEVLSNTTQEDIKQLRFQLSQIIGGSQWYSPPATNIAQINTALSGSGSIPASRVISGRKDANGQPMFLVPNGATNSAALKATSVPFTAFYNSVSQTFSADITLSGLTLAPASNNTALVNDTTLSAQAYTKAVGERDSILTIDSVGSNITALQDKYAGFKIVHAGQTEYFIGLVDTTNNRIRDCFRGFCFDSTDTWSQRRAISDEDTITLLKLSWIFSTFNSATPGLDVAYTNPVISGTQPASPASGDYWYDLTANTWKKYSGISFVSTTACMIGVTLQDTANTVAARSFDFFNTFSDLNSFEIEKVSGTVLRSVKTGPKISVYGSAYSFDYSNIVWDSSVNMDSGESIAANSNFYLYITPASKVFISSIAPHLRKFDLRGDYHPAKPYRCVGEVLTDGSSNFLGNTINIAPYHENVLPIGINSKIRQVTQSVAATFLVGTQDSHINCNATAGAMTGNLPSCTAVQAGASIFLQKTDSSFNLITLTPNGADTIDGAASTTLATQNECLELMSDGVSNWQIRHRRIPSVWTSYVPSLTGFGTTSSVAYWWLRNGKNIKIRGYHVSGTTSAALAALTLPTGLTIDATVLSGNPASQAHGATDLIGTFFNLTNTGPTAIYSTAQNPGAVVFSPADSATSVCFSYRSSAQTYTAENGSQVFNANNGVSMAFELPIVGWGV